MKLFYRYGQTPTYFPYTIIGRRLIVLKYEQFGGFTTPWLNVASTCRFNLLVLCNVCCIVFLLSPITDTTFVFILTFQVSQRTILTSKINIRMFDEFFRYPSLVFVFSFLLCFGARNLSQQAMLMKLIPSWSCCLIALPVGREYVGLSIYWLPMIDLVRRVNGNRTDLNSFP